MQGTGGTMEKIDRQAAFLGVVAFGIALIVHAALAGVVVVGSWSASPKTVIQAPSRGEKPPSEVAEGRTGPTGPTRNPGMGFIWMGVAAAFYVLPSIIAFLRGHVNKLAILATNLVFGWTGVGWLIAVIWSLTSGKDATVQVHVHQTVEK